jgi:hypothetical protein
MRIGVLAAGCLLVASPFARADATIEFERHGDCPLPMDALRISGSQLRFDTPEGSALYDGLEDTVIYLDHGRRSFHALEVDADAAEYTADVASSTMKYADRQLAKAQERMQQMCEDARSGAGACASLPAIDMQSMMRLAQDMAANAQATGGRDGGAAATQGVDPALLQQMMQQAGGALGDARASMPQPPAAPVWSDAGRDGSVAGAACRWHQQRRGETLLVEQCVADVDALPLDPRDLKGATRAVQVMQRFGRAFAPWMDAAGLDPEGEPSSRGLVLAQHCYDERGEARGSAEARIAQHGIDAAMFEVPAGYAPQRMDGMQ